MSKDCLFFAEYRAMEGMMKFCLNENAYPQEDYKNIFPECENCRFYVSESELRKEMVERQKENIELMKRMPRNKTIGCVLDDYSIGLKDYKELDIWKELVKLVKKNGQE